MSSSGTTFELILTELSLQPAEKRRKIALQSSVPNVMYVFLLKHTNATRERISAIQNQFDTMMSTLADRRRDLHITVETLALS